MALAGRTIFITGASRGIGLSIGLRAARDGANVVIAAKTTEPHPKLPGTIYTAAEDIVKAGGKALPVVVDVRDEDSVAAAVEKAVATFGGIDVLVNNASAISTTKVLDTTMKKYDLMNQINARGTFLTSKLVLPHLLKSKFTPHILVLSPPLNLDPRWLALTGTAYTIAKYGMSLSVLGMAEEFKGKVAINALWPRTGIATAAVKMLAGSAGVSACRTPEIMADSAHWILSQHVNTSGNFFIDDEVLKRAGYSDADIAKYSVTPGIPLIPDPYIGDPVTFERWVKAGELLASVGSFFKKK